MKIPGLTRKGCFDRHSHLIQTPDVDLIIISNPRNVYYYAGFLAPFPSLSQWGPVYLVIDVNDGGSTLICHNFASSAAENSYADQSQIWTWYDGQINVEGDIFSMGAKVLRDYIATRCKSVKIGIEAGFFPAIPELKQTQFIDISPSIANQQRSKYSDEIACIRYAQDCALAGHEEARRQIRAGMTEIDLYNLINSAITKKATVPIKLIGDIISGERTLEISGAPTDRVIQANDTVILDLSPVVGGYRADYTATLVVDDAPAPKVFDLEEALHAAIEAGENKLFPGTKAKEVYRAVKGCMDDRGFGEGFTRHAGHGLGLGHPEPPFFVPESNEVLVTGDVVTLEPGSYEPGCAGRIEHVFLITNDGPEQLTAHNTRFTLQ